MATVRFDRALQRALGMDKRSKEARLKRISLASYKAWRSMATELKPRYRVPYSKCIETKYNVRRSSVTLVLNSSRAGKQAKLVRSIEYGFGPGGVGTQGPYDMRKTLLKSSAAKYGRRGKYLAVPMRLTARRIKELGGSGAYNAAKRLEASVVNVNARATAWGGRLPSPSTYASKIHPRQRTVQGIGKVPPHSTDPLANLYRFKGKRPGTSTYGTFRTIASRGKPWVHPGIRARRFIRKVARRMPEIVKAVG